VLPGITCWRSIILYSIPELNGLLSLFDSFRVYFDSTGRVDERVRTTVDLLHPVYLRLVSLNDSDMDQDRDATVISWCFPSRVEFENLAVDTDATPMIRPGFYFDVLFYSKA